MTYEQWQIQSTEDKAKENKSVTILQKSPQLRRNLYYMYRVVV